MPLGPFLQPSMELVGKAFDGEIRHGISLVVM
jgi:hypothetical protein